MKNILGEAQYAQPHCEPLRNLLNPEEKFQFVLKKSLQKILICVLDFESLRLNWNDNNRLN